MSSLNKGMGKGGITVLLPEIVGWLVAPSDAIGTSEHGLALFRINKKAMLEEAFNLEKKHFYLHAEFVYLIQNGHN